MRIAVLDNGIGYIPAAYSPERLAGHSVTIIPALALGSANLNDYDMFIAPNGTDHEALYRNRQAVRSLLDNGGAVLCFCGWNTDWIPGARWQMQMNIPLRTYEITFPNPEHPLLAGVCIDEVNISNGKRGFWTCGHIETSGNADVLMVNNLNEAVFIVDENTTNGCIIATASGPLPGFSEDTEGSRQHSFDILFDNILRYCGQRQVAEQETA